MTETQNKAIVKEGTKYISDYYRKLFRDALNEEFIRHQIINSEKHIANGSNGIQGPLVASI